MQRINPLRTIAVTRLERTVLTRTYIRLKRQGLAAIGNNIAPARYNGNRTSTAHAGPVERILQIININRCGQRPVRLTSCSTQWQNKEHNIALCPWCIYRRLGDRHAFGFGTALPPAFIGEVNFPYKRNC